MAKDVRLNVRIDSKVLEKMKAYAKKNRTTVTAIIETHFLELLGQDRVVRIAKTTGEAEQV